MTRLKGQKKELPNESLLHRPEKGVKGRIVLVAVNHQPRVLANTATVDSNVGDSDATASEVLQVLPVRIQNQVMKILY